MEQPDLAFHDRDGTFVKVYFYDDAGKQTSRATATKCVFARTSPTSNGTEMITFVRGTRQEKMQVTLVGSGGQCRSFDTWRVDIQRLTAMGPVVTENKFLMHWATNAFRILNLPGNADFATLEAALENEELLARLEGEREEDPPPSWLGPVKISTAEIRLARNKLRQQPDERIRERLLWIHDLKVLEEPDHLFLLYHALAWDDPVANHDLALLKVWSASALDPYLEGEFVWLDALTAWKKIVDGEGYWEWVFETERNGNFPRGATVEEIDSLRWGALRLIITGVLTPCEEAARRGDFQPLARFLRVLGQVDAREATAIEENVLSKHEDALIGRCQAIVSECRRQVVYEENLPAEIVMRNREACMVATTRFQDEVLSPLSNAIEALGLSNDFVRRMCAAAAEGLLSLAIAWTWADDYMKFHELLVKAKRFVSADDHLSVRIADNLLLCLSALIQNTCGQIIQRLAVEIKRQEGFEKANKATCSSALQQFNNEVEPLLDELTAEASEGTEYRQKAVDAAASCLNSIASAYTWADEPQTAVELLQRALRLLPGNTDPVLHDTITKNLAEAELLLALKSGARPGSERGAESVTSARYSHSDQGRGDKVRRWLTYAIVLAVIIGYGWWSGSSPPTPTNRAAPYPASSQPAPGAAPRPAPEPDSRAARLNQLRAEIQTLKTTIGDLEEKIRKMDLELDMEETSLKYGGSSQAIQRFNQKVDERNQLFEKYKELIERHNRLVEEYNSLLRR